MSNKTIANLQLDDQKFLGTLPWENLNETFETTFVRMPNSGSVFTFPLENRAVSLSTHRLINLLKLCGFVYGTDFRIVEDEGFTDDVVVEIHGYSLSEELKSYQNGIALRLVRQTVKETRPDALQKLSAFSWDTAGSGLSMTFDQHAQITYEDLVEELNKAGYIKGLHYRDGYSERIETHSVHAQSYRTITINEMNAREEILTGHSKFEFQ